MPERGKTRRSDHGDSFRISARQQEMVTIEVNELNVDAIQDGTDIRIPLREDVIPMFHQASVFEIGAGLASQTLGTLEKSHAPAAQCELTSNDHTGETSTDDNSSRRG